MKQKVIRLKITRNTNFNSIPGKTYHSSSNYSKLEIILNLSMNGCVSCILFRKRATFYRPSPLLPQKIGFEHIFFLIVGNSHTFSIGCRGYIASHRVASHRIELQNISMATASILQAKLFELFLIRDGLSDIMVL